MFGGELIYKDLSYVLTGLLFKTHNDLGRFCNEKQYGDRIEFYLKQTIISFFIPRNLITCSTILML